MADWMLTIALAAILCVVGYCTWWSGWYYGKAAGLREAREFFQKWRL